MTRYELSKDQVRPAWIFPLHGLGERLLGLFRQCLEVLEQKEAFDLLDIDGNGKVTYQEVKEPIWTTVDTQ